MSKKESWTMLGFFVLGKIHFLSEALLYTRGKLSLLSQATTGKKMAPMHFTISLCKPKLDLPLTTNCFEIA